MKWSDRNGQTLEAALIFFVIVGIVAMFVLLIATQARANICMTVDLEPKDVLYNYDGDTYTITLGPIGIWHIREDGIDTPERTRKQPGWREAKDFTWAWLYAGPFQLHTCFDLTLGRVVGRSSRDGVTLAQALRQAGYEKVR